MLTPIDPTRPLLGPGICHDCHAPALFWFRPGGWFQRIVIGTVLGVVQYAFVRHECTGRMAARLPYADPAFRGR